MSEISFPIKDLTRRKTQTALTILGLTISTAAALFLVIFGSSLGFEITYLTIGGRLTSGFYNIFSQFIIIVSLLNLLTGPIITSFLIHLTMSGRMRDIGVMKASGCLSGSITAYFVTELSLLVILSSITGIYILTSTITYGLLGGLIFQGIYCYSDWHVILINRHETRAREIGRQIDRESLPWRG